MPSGASYWPGLATCPDRLKMPYPLERSVPIEENHEAPFSMMLGTDAIDSTLLITVGLA